MTTNDPPSERNGSRHRVVLSYHVGVAEQRRRDTCSWTASFVQEAIQPATYRNKSCPQFNKRSVAHSSSRSSGSPVSSWHRGPRTHLSPLVPTFPQTRAAQSLTVGGFGDASRCNELNTALTKKRPRYFEKTLTTTPESETTGDDELRIEGDTVENIVEEIRSKAFASVGHRSSSVFLKGIRGLSVQRTGADFDNNEALRSPLWNAVRDLVEHRGRYWKRIQMQKCSPWIMEILLASPYCANLEELHLVGVCDDDEPNASEVGAGAGAGGNPLAAHPQEQQPPQSLPESQALIVAVPLTIDCHIVSLIRKTNRLKKIVVNSCNLRNSALLRIMDVLCSHPNHPESLEHLDIRFNKLTPRAIESILAIHLRSSLHSLKTIRLRQGIRSVVHHSIRDAILRGLRYNQVVLESIDVFDWDKSVQFFLDANRAKRRNVFSNNDRFSRSLWPLLLEQPVAIDELDEHDDDGRAPRRTRSPYRSSIRIVGGRNVTSAARRREASVIYHLFRNGGPMLLQQQSHAAAPTSQ
mmetsp:Transcript_10635/g.25183  ORF Transcript_10635/g.25183 Transcript_10635/m.25183 type:complete len:524 (-) Transcript_10635:242-1813(-)